MEFRVASRLAVSRGRHGVAILIAAGFFLMIVRFTVFSERNLNFDTPINLPIPDSAKQPKPEPLRETHTLFNTSTLLSSGSCNIELINSTNFDKTVNIDLSQNLAIEGWLADLAEKNMAKLSWVEFIGKDSTHDYAVPIRFRVRRPDVQDYLGGRPTYAMAGFVSEIAIPGLASGEYHVLIVYKSGDNFYRCDNGRHVLIQGDSSGSQFKTP